MKEPFSRLPRAAHAEPPAHAPNAALMIDFDNVTLGIRSDLQHQLQRLLNSEIIKGKVAVQRAYADWRRYPQYIAPLSQASIDLIFAPAFGSNKKNATDIRLAIDALELVFTRPEIGTFILLSGDSDFSSLVLKLKEYGKYVIGVGIRESSSDLLVQNCDEYYSYSEITGLTRQSEAVPPSRDPWQLVVDAVTQMRADGDVMRSDRLKQVMQELDPTFNEKDVGFSRFSKFVTEASQRGLVRITKLDNGQFEIDLGPNANVPPAVEAAMRDEGAAAAPAVERPRREERRPRRPRVSGAVASTMTLAAALEGLRSALLELGALGDEATDADQVRERMIERSGAPNDPIFERTRFQRLLRQAHDANVIELIKSGEAYLLKLGTQATEPEAQEPVEQSIAAERHEEPARRGGRPRGRRGGRGGRGGGGGGGGGRGRSERRDEERPGAAIAPAARADEAPVLGIGTIGTVPAGPEPRPDARPNPRFRRGSRGPAARTAPTGASSAKDVMAPPPPPSIPELQPASASRSVRHRSGSRGGSPTRAPVAAIGTAQGPGVPAASAPSGERSAAPRPERPQPAEHVARTDGSGQRPPGEQKGGFLRRMSAALQKAVRGPAGEHKGDT